MKRDIQLVDGLAWNFCGNYVFYAVAMAVEKNLAGNKARLEYIKEPLMKDIELTEEEKRQKAIDEFVASINRMKANFDNSKKK